MVGHEEAVDEVRAVRRDQQPGLGHVAAGRATARTALLCLLTPPPSALDWGAKRSHLVDGCLLGQARQSGRGCQ